MPPKSLTRRDFLKLVPMGMFSMAAVAPLLKNARPLLLPDPHPPLFPVGPISYDVLSSLQKKALFKAAQRFIAPSEEEANQVALQIDFIEGLNEHASNMCGPLSITIMRTAELLGNWVAPSDFWLLNPRQDLRTAANVFPPHLYDWHHFTQPVSQFDFSRFPLLTGDLLYLHAAAADTFEHILLVNRVDDSGRAFTVTNFFTDKGTIIEERMLYDPANFGTGQFQTWADRKFRNTIGLTGSGGFRIWRIKDGRKLEFPKDEANLKMSAHLDEIFLSGEGKWYAAINEAGGRALYKFNPFERFHPASTIKVALAIAFLAWVDQQKAPDFDAYLNEKGTSGRSFAQLLEAMIVNSEELATEALVQFLDPLKLTDTWRDWGFPLSQINPRRSSATEIIRFFEGLLLGQWLTQQSRDLLLSLLARYTPSDETRLGLIKPLLPTGSVILNKRASLVPYPKIVGDSGIIHIPSSKFGRPKDYIFSVHGLATEGSLYESLEAQLDKAILAFGEFLTSA